MTSLVVQLMPRFLKLLPTHVLWLRHFCHRLEPRNNISYTGQAAGQIMGDWAQGEFAVAEQVAKITHACRAWV